MAVYQLKDMASMRPNQYKSDFSSEFKVPTQAERNADRAADLKHQREINADRAAVLKHQRELNIDEYGKAKAASILKEDSFKKTSAGLKTEQSELDADDKFITDKKSEANDKLAVDEKRLDRKSVVYKRAVATKKVRDLAKALQSYQAGPAEIAEYDKAAAELKALGGTLPKGYSPEEIIKDFESEVSNFASLKEKYNSYSSKGARDEIATELRSAESGIEGVHADLAAKKALADPFGKFDKKSEVDKNKGKLKNALNEARVVLGISQNAASNALKKWEGEKTNNNASLLTTAKADYNKQRRYYNAILKQWQEASGIVVNLEEPKLAGAGAGAGEEGNGSAVTDPSESEVDRATRVQTEIDKIAHLDNDNKYLTNNIYDKTLGKITGITRQERNAAALSFDNIRTRDIDRTNKKNEEARKSQDQFIKMQDKARSLINNARSRFKSTLETAVAEGNLAAIGSAIKAGIRVFDPGQVTGEDATLFSGGSITGKLHQLKSLFSSGNENMETAIKIIKLAKETTSMSKSAAAKKAKLFADTVNEKLQTEGLDKYKVKAQVKDFYIDAPSRTGGNSGGSVVVSDEDLMKELGL